PPKPHPPTPVPKLATREAKPAETKAAPPKASQPEEEHRTEKESAPDLPTSDEAAPRPAPAPQADKPRRSGEAEEAEPKSTEAILAALPRGTATGTAEFESEKRGKGGGDRYLNSVRDAIVSNIRYPEAARGFGARAVYQIVILRSGFLYGQPQLVRSS